MEVFAQILKEGFKPFTHFAKDLDAAISQGGNTVFQVWFDEEPCQDWQYVSRVAVPPEAIARAWIFDIKALAVRKETLTHARRKECERDYPGDAFCEQCEGRGQDRDYELFRTDLENRTCTVCKKCGGYGRTKKDGRPINITTDAKRG